MRNTALPRHSTSFANATNDPRRPASDRVRRTSITGRRNRPGLLLRVAIAIVLSGAWPALTACAWLGPPVIAPELISQDYYFTGSYVQIQGEADLPPVRQLVPAPAHQQQQAGSRDSKATVQFLSLRERRKQCRERALVHSHTKWLSLTRRDRQAQSEWDLRLSMGGSGGWQECLNRSVIRNHFYDAPGRCRVVVLYPCLPQRY